MRRARNPEMQSPELDAPGPEPCEPSPGLDAPSPGLGDQEKTPALRVRDSKWTWPSEAGGRFDFPAPRTWGKCTLTPVSLNALRKDARAQSRHWCSAMAKSLPPSSENG
jgi:hypothetical protein